MKEQAQPKSSHVSRSVYQKLKEENKALLKDIEILVTSINPNEVSLVADKWHKKFTKDVDFNEMLKAHAKQYLKDHPEYDITSPHFKKP